MVAAEVHTLKIALPLMSRFKKLNSRQLEVATYDSGQMLVLAGPGSGKTECLTLCAMNLLLLEKAIPSQIILCTYTRKAAFELQDRISYIANEMGYRGKISEMRIDTIHGICNRLISENLHRFVNLKEHILPIGDNFQTLDRLSQKLLIFDYLDTLCGSSLNGFMKLWRTRWEVAKKFQQYFEKITEEFIELSELQETGNSFYKHLAEAYIAYRELLTHFNYLDFAHLQRVAYDILGHEQIAGWVTKDIRYVFVDEYQDTNYIQEQILFKLAARAGNICVVGDEDQCLYRFRGATAQSFNDFCKVYPAQKIMLSTNYRSHTKIIELYNNWMASVEWGKYRKSKKILPPEGAEYAEYPAVLAVNGSSSEDEAEQLAELVYYLKEQGQITDYDQVALLIHSVRPKYSAAYVEAFQKRGIPSFCPRARAYFEQHEICLLIGCLASIFEYADGDEIDVVGDDSFHCYVQKCSSLLAQDAEMFLILQETLQGLKSELLHTDENSQMKLSDYFFALLAAEPFVQFMKDEKKIYNLGKFSRLLSIFENYHHYAQINRENAQEITWAFFHRFLCLLFKDGDNESDDLETSFPQGYLPIMTIHQAKGLEFPVVIVGGLDRTKSELDDVDRHLQRFFRRKRAEPVEHIPSFDHLRLFYVAFSRAMDMLILTCNRRKKPSDKYLRAVVAELPQWPYIQADLLPAHPFRSKSLPVIKPRFSFTSVQEYETCPRRYQMYREFKFAHSRPEEVFFGILVHQTIEKIHRIILDRQASSRFDALLDLPLRQLFDQTYYFLACSMMHPLEAHEREKAFEQVTNYFMQNLAEISYITEAEADISIEMQNYVLNGKIDVLLMRNGKREIMDLKTSRKLELDAAKLETYKRQLSMYAYMLEQRDASRPERLALYWTEEPHRENACMVFPYQPEEVESFKKIVTNIESKNFEMHEPPPFHVCKKCDFRTLCIKEGLIEHC